MCSFAAVRDYLASTGDGSVPHQPPDPNAPQERVWRKELRVTHAITASHLHAWTKGYSTLDIDTFMKHHFPTGYDYNLTLNYQQFFFEHYFLRCNVRKNLDPDVVKASLKALQISTDNWANMEFGNITYSVLNSCQLARKVNGVRGAVDSLVLQLANGTSQSLYVIDNTGTMEINTHGDMLVCTSKLSNKKIVIPWMALVAVQEAVIGMLDSLLFVIAEDSSTGLEDPMLDELELFINAGIQSAVDLGEVVYDVLKAMHALSVGKLLDVLDEGFQNQLYTSTLAEVPECRLKTWVTRDVLGVDDAVRRLAVSSVAKCFTYPVIDVDSSVENVVSKSTRFNPCRRAGNKALWVFRKLFCREFVKKNKSWPPVIITGEIPGVISDAIRDGTWPELARQPWPSAMFEHVVIQECLSFDWQIDITSALSDKAIAGPLLTWPLEFDRRMHRIYYGRGVKTGKASEKRLLVEFIKREEVSVAQEVLGYLSDREGIKHFAVMCLKEKELNRKKGRYFTKNTFAARMYQVTLEKNMNTILDYIPVTSMRFSGDTLQRFLLAKSKDDNTAKLAIDYSKWCQYQRAGLVNPVAEQIDLIFGVSPLYKNAHLEPMRTHFLFQDSACIPEQGPNMRPLPGPRSYYGLATFGEGMLQRLWTVVSSCGVLAHIENTDLQVEMVGSGDNQIIMCPMPPGKTPDEVHRILFTALRSFEEEADLRIKLMETFISCKYMEYGKACYINGKKIAFGLKRATRIGTESQENIPSINTKISGCCATGIAAAADSLTPAAAYIVTCYEVLTTVMQRLNRRVQFERMVVLLLLNRQAGGLKMSLYPSFCVRGVDDHLPTCVSIWTYVKGRPEYANIYRSFRAMPGGVKRAMDWSQLVKDPYSIPVVRPKDAD